VRFVIAVNPKVASLEKFVVWILFS